MAGQRLSGIQREVLSLYRACLRAARAKRPLAQVVALREHARADFRRHAATVPRGDYRTIEFLLRQGRRRLQALAPPDVKFSVVRVRRATGRSAELSHIALASTQDDAPEPRLPSQWLQLPSLAGGGILPPATVKASTGATASPATDYCRSEAAAKSK
eukprot:SM000051S17589  [mRNA]  locus=s51:560086:560761:- [translate_table: standard]